MNACSFYKQWVAAGTGTDTDTRTTNLFIQVFAFQWKESSTSFFWLLSFGHFSHQFSCWLRGTSISTYPSPLLRAGLILPGFSRLLQAWTLCRLGSLQHLGPTWSSWQKVSLYLNGVFHGPACACCHSSRCCASPRRIWPLLLSMIPSGICRQH